MEIRKLDIPSGYSPTNQRMVGLFAAQLDNQSWRLKKDLDGLTTEHLEWQSRPGMNTIGMLLAHFAIVELFWINVATHEIPLEPDGDDLIKRITGIRMDDDGLPLKEVGKHPQSLAGRSLEDYWKMLDAARAEVHNELGKWTDSDLERTFALRDKQITRSWTVYHVLEHFAAHYGQILMLKHMMRDAGVLAKK